MTHLQPAIHINATPEKIWNILWDDTTYRIWVAPFHEGSYYKADRFEEGATIHFLTPTGEGMYSIIDKLIPNRYLAFRHQGSIIDYKEQDFTPETEAWNDVLEAYTLIPDNNNSTTLKVDFHTTEEYKEFMTNAFDESLKIIKRLAEA
jgi:hypothetical protein